MTALLICTLAEARARAGTSGEAPRLAALLRRAHPDGVCILDARDGLAWIDTPHASGWLAGEALEREAFERRTQEALARGFVAADALVLARRTAPHALPLLSWGEAPPQPQRTPSAPQRLDLYAIVDDARRLRQVLEAGVRTVQLRIKTPPAPDAAWHAMLREEVADSVAASREHGAELFVNDHWRLARELGASGVHLGQEDLLALGDEGRAELLAAGFALGVSSHSVWELARARALSPRYIACGPVWPTVTKDMPWLPQGLDNLAWWVRAAGAPVTAIGGILQPQHVEAVAGTGCDGVCIVRGLGEAPRDTLPGFEAALRAGRSGAAEAPPDWPHASLPAGKTP